MDANQRHAYLQKCRRLIAEHGHMVQSVIGAFSYTIGLTPTLGYELVTVGLPPQVAQTLLNDVAKRLAQGPISDGEDIAELANMPMRLQTVSVLDAATGRTRREVVSFAYQLGYTAPTFRQLVWPDKNGRFPGDAGYAHHCSQVVDDVIDPEPSH